MGLAKGAPMRIQTPVEGRTRFFAQGYEDRPAPRRMALVPPAYGFFVLPAVVLTEVPSPDAAARKENA